MRVQFIGVGEAFDETLANNSQILEWPGCRLLIDCGYSVPHSLWKLQPDPEYVDAVYLSHRHADHYFGLPSYLVRLAEDGRKKPIEVLCPEGMKDAVTEMIDYAYLNLLPKLDLEVTFKEVFAGEALSYRGATLEFAPSSHPVKNFAIAVTCQGRKYSYSGDGNFTPFTRKIFHGSRILVHEAYEFEIEKFGHACIKNLLTMAREENVETLALTHLQRDLRRTRLPEIQQYVASSPVKVIVPNAGDVLEV